MFHKMEGYNKMEETEELDVQETRQIIGPDSFDDNFNLLGYTSELRDRNDNFFAFVDFNADGEGKLRFCDHCEEFGFKHKLKPRILEKGEARPPDYDQFIQCHFCGNVYPIHETHFEPKIKDSLESVQTPFDTESVFLSTDSRATQRRKGKRKSRFKVGEHEDPEIQMEIDRHGSDNVRIIQ